MILIFVDEVTERLLYTLDFVFSERKVEYRITNDLLFFQKTVENKFYYSNQSFEEVSGLKPATVLFDDAIFPYSILKSVFENEECLSFDSITDPLASIFYILSRMEEYVIQKRDFHERFQAVDSILFKNNWLQKAVCDRWSMAFITYVEKTTGVDLNRVSPKVEIIPTFDIDNTFAFKWKPFGRKVLSILRDRLARDKVRQESRKAFLKYKAKDPYDTFEYILDIQQRGFNVHLFWLLGDYAKYDKNISSLDLRHIELIRTMSKYVTIGLHPSYKSNTASYFLEKEKFRIEDILNHEVTISRQHFLKLSLPVTYQNLIKKGFTDDYTMGYAEEIGFRAGTARAFKFFDLSANSMTNYVVHPFAYMDGTLNEYKKYTIEESISKITDLFNEVQFYGGDFICIWHNETIGDFGKWKEWSDVLEFTLKLKDVL